MNDVTVFPDLRSFGRAAWTPLAAGEALDCGYSYLTFREWLEPGDPLVLACIGADGPRAALHAVWTTVDSALFSHPWKFLCADQRLRAGNEAELAVRRGERDRLLHALGARGTDWRGLTSALGEALVVRGFDRSRVLLHPDEPSAGQAALCAALIDAAQAQVRAGRAGAVVLPFVDPGDEPLRGCLAAAGFRHATTTAAAIFELSGFATFADYLAAMPTRTRSRYRNEMRDFDRSGDRIVPIELAAHLERVVDLEVRTLDRHGSHPNRAGLLRARQRLTAMMPGATRVPAIVREGRPVACGVELFDERSCFSLSYGCDYRLGEGSIGYHSLCFYEPIDFCLRHRISRLHLGFEALLPKKIRGARVHPRELWAWLPDPARLAALGSLLDHLGRATDEYLRPLR